MSRLVSRRDHERAPLWLWAFTTGVAATYAVLAWRTSPGADTLQPQPGAPPTPEGSAPSVPFVSVIVPARDEERNIRRCVSSLLDQDYPAFEVIVVDDDSRDATPAILRDLREQHPHGERLCVVRLDTLPPGWAGKPHALHAGATHARGSWLLFTDADTEHAPLTLSSAVNYARHTEQDLVSLATEQELPGFWNRVLMPIAYMGISAMYPARQVNDPNQPVAIANGQYILVRRAAYDAIGGYASPALRTTLVDDRDLAQRIKAAGYRLRLVDGRRFVRTAMYRGLRDHWRGWSKNVYAGSRGGPLLFALMTAGLLSITVAPIALLLAGFAGGVAAWRRAGAVQVGAIALYRWPLDRALGVPWGYALTHPLGGAVFTAILARAGWRRLTGQSVEWRGRQYHPTITPPRRPTPATP